MLCMQKYENAELYMQIWFIFVPLISLDKNLMLIVKNFFIIYVAKQIEIL